LEDPVPGELLQIGALAERIHLSLRTVRYYEQAGVFEPAGRTAGGYHLYDARAVERLLLIKRMKPLGFTLEEMRALLALRDELFDVSIGGPRRDELHARLRTWIAVAEEKLTTLREQVAAAEDLVARLHDSPANAVETDLTPSLRTRP